MKRNKWKKIILACFVIGALVFSFWYGGDAPGLQGFSVSQDETVYDTPDTPSDISVSTTENAQVITDNVDKNDSGKFSFKNLFMKIKQTGSNKAKKNPQINKKAQSNANKAADRSEKKNKKKKSNKKSNTNNNTKNNSNSDEEKGGQSDSSNESGANNSSEDNAAQNESNNNDNKNDNNSGSISSTDNTVDNKNKTTQTDNATVNNTSSQKDNNDADSNSITCTIYISCASVLNHMDELTESTKKVIPKDGVILASTDVKVKKDATVFDVLQKAARENKVHLEYNYTPAYKTYYIEGIGNLYQFDAGNLSGWMYSVNGEFPGVGCSGYKVKDGDKINWVYTCSFGKDVGGYVESGD